METGMTNATPPVPPASPATQGAGPRTRWLPALLFVLGLLLTYAVGSSFQNKARSVEELNYRAATEALKTLIVSDFGRHAEVVWGVRALIAAQGDVVPAQVENYLQTVRLQEAYPGIGALYVVTAQAGPLQTEPDFELAYAYTPYQQLDLGQYELRSDATTLDALEQAMRRNAVVLTGRSGGPFQEVFPGSHLLVLPVYADAFVPDNLTERRASIDGWIVAVFTPREWLASALRLLQTPLDFSLKDAHHSPDSNAGEQPPLFVKGTPVLQGEADRLRLGGREFLLTTSASSALLAQQRHAWELGLIYGLGALTSLLVALAIGVLLNRRWHIERRADELAADLERMSYVARFTKNPVVITSPDNRIVWANEAFERLNGYTQADTLGRTVPDLVASPNADPQALEVLARAREQREGAEVETINRSRDGRDYWARIELRPLYNARGQFVGHMSIHTDVDQDKRNAAALKAALRDTKALMATLQRYMIITETSPDGRILEANQRYLEISGYGMAELQVKGHRAVSSGLHSRPFWVGMWDAISRGQPWRGEICNKNRDGQLYWVDTLIAPFTDEQGEIEKFVSVGIDITERKRIEQDLLTSERLLRRTGRIAGVGAWTVDLSTQTVTWSDEALRLLRADPDQPPPTLDSVRERSSSQAQLTLQYAWTEALEHDQAFDLELELTNFAGEERWFRVAGEVEQRGLRGRMLVGALQDITERVLAQQRIERSERILRTAIDAIDEGFVLYDPDDRLVYCNERYREVYPQIADLIVPGVHFEDLVRGGIERGLFPDAQGREAEFLAERMAMHRSEHTDAEQQQASGRWIRITERKTPEGYTVGFRVDITAFKQAVADAQAASRSKSQFVANMSHEIRTPMNAILGMLELLQRSQLDARQHDYVGKTRGAAQSLLGILNDILDFSKVEAGKMELHTEPCRLDDLLEELSLILSSNLGSKPLELLFELDPALPRLLMADQLRLKQVLINLGGNAVKFTPEGEVVLRIKVSRREGQRVWLMFSVADTGIGISDAQRAVIFQGFSQAEASTTRRFGGTGLGLAITQRLVHLMGGTLQVESEPGRGSVFYFELPFDVPSEVPYAVTSEVSVEKPQPPAATQPQDAPAPRRLLLVEPHPRSREVHRRLAEQAGWQVHAVAAWNELWGDVWSDAKNAPNPLPSHPWPWPGTAPHAVLLAPLGQRLGPADAAGWQQVLQLAQASDSARPALLLLSHVAQPDVLPDLAAGASLGAAHMPRPDGVLVKPVTGRMLEAGLAQAQAAAQALAGTCTTAGTPHGPAPEPRLAGLRLLVVEDNPVNQQVARELLGQEGADVAVADNGLVGVQRVTESPQPFDAILMDMQMPVMDGLEATRQLRAAGYAQLPIVAMTANALNSDREICLAAGMNEHVGKPFDLEKLVQLLLRLTRRAGPGHATMPMRLLPDTAMAPATLDTAAALRRMGGDEAFYRRTLQRVLPDLRALVDGLVDSLAAPAEGAVPGVTGPDTSSSACAHQRQQAHSIKGLAATVGADALAACAAQLEDAARQGQLLPVRATAMALQAFEAQATNYLEAGTGAGAGGGTGAGSVAGAEASRPVPSSALAPLAPSDPADALAWLRKSTAALAGMAPLLNLFDMRAVELYDNSGVPEWWSWFGTGSADESSEWARALLPARSRVGPLVSAMEQLDFVAAQTALGSLLLWLEHEEAAAEPSS